MERYPVKKISECIDCGICVSVCTHRAIQINSDDEGFEYPYINSDTCKDCGRCSLVCPQNFEREQDKQFTVVSYAGHFKDANEQLDVTSGGFCTALAHAVINKGGIVYGVTYTEDFSSTAYFCVKKDKDLHRISGVKYTQAHYPNINEISCALKNGSLVLFIGLPCVVTAMKQHFQDYDNFISIALFCQGVSTPLVQYKLKEQIHEKYGIIVSQIIREKHNGKVFLKHEIMDKNRDKTVIIRKDWNYNSYHTAISLIKRECCYDCKYKYPNIRTDYFVGDYWGLEDDVDFYSVYGNSAIVVTSEKGKRYLTELENFTLKNKDTDDIFLRNGSALRSVTRSYQRDKLVNSLQTNSLDVAVKLVIPFEIRVKSKIRAVFLSILPRNMVRRIRENKKKKVV